MKHLVRISALLIAICLIVSGLSACGSNDSLSTDDIADRLKGFSSSETKWNQLDGEQLPSYFGFKEDIIEEFTVYVNGAEEHFDIIAVVKPTDKDARTEVIQGLTFAMTTASGNFKASNEAEYKKIISGRIVEADDILILAIIDNYEEIDEYFEEIKAKAPKTE